MEWHWPALINDMLISTTHSYYRFRMILVPGRLLTDFWMCFSASPKLDGSEDQTVSFILFTASVKTREDQQLFCCQLIPTSHHMAMDQYLLIPFLGGWTSIYQLFWCSPGVQGFDTLPYPIQSPWTFPCRSEWTVLPIGCTEWHWVALRCSPANKIITFDYRFPIGWGLLNWAGKPGAWSWVELGCSLTSHGYHGSPGTNMQSLLHFRIKV